MLLRWMKSPGTLTINTVHVGLHGLIFEFEQARVAFLVVLWHFVLLGILVLMYHVNKTGEITSIPGDCIPSDHWFL